MYIYTVYARLNSVQQFYLLINQDTLKDLVHIKSCIELILFTFMQGQVRNCIANDHRQQGVSLHDIVQSKN